jgi:hypothetical protein
MAYTLNEKVQENNYCKNIQLPHEEQDNILNSRNFFGGQLHNGKKSQKLSQKSELFKKAT